MSINEILSGGGGLLLVALTLIQITPVKINPWSWAAKLPGKAVRALGRVVNADVLQQLAVVQQEQANTRECLDRHVLADDRRTADGHRTRVLHFNNELLRDIDHTKEEFIEVLAEIDAYEDYCREKQDYPNNRAVLAIENIREVYKERLKKHDFLQESSAVKQKEGV